MERAVRVNGWLEGHKRPEATVTWICFAAVCADYAHFIDLPTIVVVPFWMGVAANVLRWAVWERMVKPKLAAGMADRERKWPPLAAAETQA